MPMSVVTRATSLLALILSLLTPATGAPAQSSSATVGMAVTVTRASRTCFTDTLQVSGILMPREEVFVRPESEGLQVSQITVEDGERVTSGQILARLTRLEGLGPAATATVRAPSAGIV